MYLSVLVITFEPLHIEGARYIFTNSRSGLSIKVIGSSSRSYEQMIILESCCLYQNYSYTENLPIPRVFSRMNNVLNILQELSLTISQKKFIQENRTKLSSHQKAELGPLLPETPWLKCQKVLRFVVNNQIRLNPILSF